MKYYVTNLSQGHWSTFKDSEANFDEYVTAVTDFISKGVEDRMPKKSTRVFAN